MIRDKKEEMISRLKAKTLEETFKEKMREGLGCSNFEAEAVMDTVKEVFFPVTADTVAPGQMVILAISVKEPPNKPLRECAFLPVVVTLHAGAQDDEVRKEGGVVALRRRRLLRISKEAADQGALLTAEDFAYRVFNCGMRTMSRDLKALRDKGIHVPLRSQQKDIGRALTHRVEAVELYLKRKTYSQIRERIHHSHQSIKNYITQFASVATMTRQGLSVREIAFVTQVSVALVRDYQDLLSRYDTPEYKDRIDEIISRAGGNVVDLVAARRTKKGESES